MGTRHTRNLSGATASWLIAKLTLKRLSRSKSLIVTGIFLLLPIVFASSLAGASEKPEPAQWEIVFAVFNLMLVILPPLHLAVAVAEEVEDKTFTYLWSRPFPRWSLIVGKLITLAPLVAVGLGVSMVVCWRITMPTTGSEQTELLIRSIGAIGVGVVALGCVSVGVGSLIHRQALVSAVAYALVLDLPIGELPFAMSNLSITHQVQRVAAVELGKKPAVDAFIWMAAVAAIWLAVAFWRISRAEYATDR